MPFHRTYVEPFLGGGSVLLNKRRSDREIAGDLDRTLINLWVHIQRLESPLSADLKGIKYDSDSFDFAGRVLNETEGVSRLTYSCRGRRFDEALAAIVRNRFSRGGLGKTFAWSDRLRGGKPGDENAWDTIRAELPRIADRIQGVTFHCRSALELIAGYDGIDTLYYLDPPYVPATRTAKKAYGLHEMTAGDHEKLLAAILGLKGMAMISGYRHPLYDDALASWTRHDREMPNHSGQGKSKQRRVESLWLNPACSEALP